MPYVDRLKRWVVVCWLSSTQSVHVARFLRYSDAEGHAQALRRMNPTLQYRVIFDAGTETTETEITETEQCLEI